MGWPLSQDYNEAVQDPASCFGDDELRRGRPTLNTLGIPLPRSGNFADVYEFTCPDRAKWAVKCFTRQVPGLRQRYAAVSRHLRQADLPFGVDFHFLEEGIRIAGRWYPALKMRWVEGLLLNEFVRSSLDRPAVLDALAQIWLRMAQRLRAARVAHGDLQHGNVLLVPGSKTSSLAVKLVDYDGMWVPALAGAASAEVGHPNYQHPQRLRRGGYGPEVDRFPLLVAATALRALAVSGPALWGRYDNGDNLLFREADLVEPGRSALFAELEGSADPLVRSLAGHLQRACALPPEHTPLLEEVLVPGRPAPSVQITPEPIPVSVVLAQPVPVQATARTVPEVADEAQEEPEAVVRDTRRSRREGVRAGVPVWVWAIAAVGVVAVWLAVAVAWTVMQGRKPVAAATEPALAVAPPEPASRAREQPPPVPPSPARDRVEVRAAPPQPDPALPARPALFRFLADDADLVAVSDHDPAAWVLYDPDRHVVVRRFWGHKGPITAFAATPDGRVALTVSDENTACVWDTATGATAGLLRGDSRPFRAVAISADGKRAASAHGAAVLVWDVARHTTFGGFPTTGDVTALAFSADGAVLACGLAGAEPTGVVVLHDAATLRPLYRFSAPEMGTPSALAFSPDAKILAVGGTGRRAYLLHRATNSLISDVPPLMDGVRDLLFSPDGRTLLLMNRNGFIHWDSARAKTLLISLHPKDWTVASRFGPAGTTVVTVNYEGPAGPINRFSVALKRPPTNRPNPPLAGAGGRLPMPADQEVAAARSQLREMFPELRVARLDSRASIELWRKLREVGLGRGEQSPAMRYTALLELRDLEVKRGQFRGAMQTVRTLADRYAVDRQQLQCDVAEWTAPVVRDVEAANLVEDVLRLADLAVGVDDFAQAARLVEAAQQALTAVRGAVRVVRPASQAASVVDLTAAVQLAGRDLALVRPEFDRIREAVQVVARDRLRDPKAMLAVGRFRCVFQDDWEEGLQLLAGVTLSDPWTSLASQDLHVRDDAAARKRLADAWLAAADKVAGADRDAFRRRAHYWYREALPGLQGKAEADARDHIAAIERQVPQLRDRWRHMNLAGSLLRGDHFHMRKSKVITSRKCYRGGVDLTVVARTEKNNIRLNAGDGGEVIFNWEGTRGGVRIHAPSGTGRYPGPYLGAVPLKLEPHAWHTLRWRLTPTQTEVWADGKLIFQTTGSFDMSVPRPVGVRTHFDSAIDVRSVEVRAVRGQ
jgi:hypothetical protein